MQLSLKQVTNKWNKASKTWKQMVGADGLPSVGGSTSPSINWSESIKEIKNRHYNLSKATQ